MTWFYYSECTAFFEASTAALSKKALKDCGVYTIAWVRFGYAVPFLVCALMFIEIPPLDTTFFIMVAVLIPLEALGTVLYIRAIVLSPVAHHAVFGPDARLPDNHQLDVGRTVEQAGYRRRLSGRGWGMPP